MRNSIKAPTLMEERIIKLLILLALFSTVHFLFFFLQFEHQGNAILFFLLSITISYSIFKKLYMWYNYANISIPEKPSTSPEVTVDILTTYFPGEPYQMVVTTLEAITNISHPHTSYLCDEANDPYLKGFCEKNGIIHVTRHNRKDAKAGNINNALRSVATGDICVVLDPDHIPEPDFLDVILPYFADPEIGFVQTVQSYYNIKDTLVARGAAEQTFQFYGPMMMTLNSYKSVNAIGANCVFRRKALDSIGGHAPGLCEDMHTAMLLYAQGWKAVYVPEVLARGLAPSNLTTYYKQQLKWARGTFDLLFKVYPRVFKKLNVRQKIHFGILPLHYLSGVMYLLNFLIPVLALVFSTTPWEGNIIDFILALLPVAMSALLIRAFVQKWVIEKEERGFHLTGGLLQINTWWIYILGFVYTIFNKNVPYLPTPKQSEFNTNLKIVIPNIAVAAISVFAIIYGLRRDFTPFSIFMAGFALFNTCIMLFGIYLTVKVTNQNRILRSNLSDTAVRKLFSTKQNLRNLFHKAFTFTRKGALPLLVLVLFSALAFKQQMKNKRWENVEASYHSKKTGKLIGIFHPPEDSGWVDLEDINALEARNNINFDIISVYMAWNEENIEHFPDQLLNSIAVKNAVPMFTWEPWSSDFDLAEENPDLRENRRIFKYIHEGLFDDYIIKFADKLAHYNKPVFLRFAHEFNNPAYPWSADGGNTPADFKAAWRHVHEIMKDRGANEVMLVWNPWDPQGMEQYYPGDQYVDWIGLTMLDYQGLNKSGAEVPFEELYLPFRNKLQWFTRKPVMLTEFGSLNLNGNQNSWLKNAMAKISGEFGEIGAVVLFNSAYDNNIPANNQYNKPYLDWTTDSLSIISAHLEETPLFRDTSPSLIAQKREKKPVKNVKGVRYKKGEDWRDNYYVLTREQLLADFKKMKEAGINTVHFKGGNIYEYNLLKYIGDMNLKGIYEFDIDLSKGFINRESENANLAKKILDKVEELKSNPAIVSYSFNYNLDLYYSKPLLFYQKRAYADWLAYLITRIKEIDPKKSIFLDLPLKRSTAAELFDLNQTIPVDAFGLMLKDTSHLKRTLILSKERNIPVFLSSTPTEFLKEVSSLPKTPVVLENWQDERYSHRLSFDGLLDFSGRKKRTFYAAQDHFRFPKDREYSAVKIVKPAIPLLPHQTLTYNAAFYEDNKWLQDSQISEDFSFEWKLIKNDIFGNPLAAQDIGEGKSVNVRIPEGYKNYEILLSVTRKDSDGVLQSREILHTPILKRSGY
ncbi:glycosyltransferase [Salinimicrobium sp. CDJ15-81-2]|nr:glycosyltransferase [Salinimicrobium nanhaiense]